MGMSGQSISTSRFSCWSTNEYIAALKKSGFAAVSHRRIVDSTPLPEDWTPTHWFPSRQDHLKFRAEGALLLVAEK